MQPPKPPMAKPPHIEQIPLLLIIINGVEFAFAFEVVNRIDNYMF
jgi:hypothetical protein